MYVQILDEVTSKIEIPPKSQYFKTKEEMQQQQMINYGVGGVPPGSAMVYNMLVPIRSRTFDLYKHKQSKRLGITLIIIGILCILFNAVSIGLTETQYYYTEVAKIGHGIWCGILFIMTGCFGIGAGVQKTKCLIVSFMVMCIISAITTISLLTIGIIGACEAADQCHYDNYGYDYNYPYYNPPCEKMNGYLTLVAMESMMAILGFVAGIVAIWGSALCCGSGVCCRCTHSTPFIAPQQLPGHFPNNGHIVYLHQSHMGQNFYLPQSMAAYPQGIMAPPYVANVYTQPGWIMPPPTDSNDPLIGQAPPLYSAGLQVTSAQGQPTEQRKF